VSPVQQVFSHKQQLRIDASPTQRSFSSQHRYPATLAMKVIIVPVLEDNYAYLLVDEASKTACAVDPADPIKVQEAAKEHGLSISHVLTTHHHWDHAQGNETMKKDIPSVEICGGDQRIPAMTKHLQHGEEFSVANGAIKIRTIASPCHTSGHVLYYATGSGSAPVIFTGDTLFVAGCGRFFEGTAEQMCEALLNRIASLPDETLVYCGHEYTVKNLKFALSLPLRHAPTEERLKWAEALRAQGKPTVPSTVGDEKRTNPFMRVKEPSMAEAVGLSAGASYVEVMTKLRALKDKF
jgi:hydroxyacylglutathione hydrolase